MVKIHHIYYITLRWEVIMNKNVYLIAIFFILVFALSVTSCCAFENNTDVLEFYDNQSDVSVENQINSSVLKNNCNTSALKKYEFKQSVNSTFYYDAEKNIDVDCGNLIQAKNLKMYYKDGSKFKVKFVDLDGNPQQIVFCLYKNIFESKYKLSDSNGATDFKINWNLGTYHVLGTVEDYEGDDYMWAKYKITVKSTVPTSSLKKSVKQKNKPFSIKFLDKKGNVLKNKKVKLKIKSKTHSFKINSKGIVKVKINSFKVGKHSITAINSVTGEKRKITVKITK